MGHSVYVRALPDSVHVPRLHEFIKRRSNRKRNDEQTFTDLQCTNTFSSIVGFLVVCRPDSLRRTRQLDLNPHQPPTLDPSNEKTEHTALLAALA